MSKVKLMSEIPDEEYKTLSELSEKEKANELSYYEKVIANGTPITEGDMISREGLKAEVDEYYKKGGYQ